MGRLVLAAALLLGAVACADEPGDAAEDCPVGSEACSCTTGGACNPGLECLSSLCVAPATGAGGAGGGGGSGGESGPPEIALRESTDPSATPITSVAFGQVQVGQTEERFVVVVTLQSTPLQVGVLQFRDQDGTSAAAFSVDPPGPLSVASVSPATLRIRFSPNALRDYAAVLVIPSNDPVTPELSVPLTGEGVSGEIRVVVCESSIGEAPDRCANTEVEAPATLDLGAVFQRAVGQAHVTIFNDGSFALNVRSVTFADPAAAEAQGFALVGDVGRRDVPPQSSTGFNVELGPTDGHLGPVEARVVVASDDANEPEVEVTVRADAVPNSPPRACLYIRSILHRDGTLEGFVPGDSIPTVEPLETVTFDALRRADCSFDSEDGLLLTDVWTVTGPGDSISLRAVDGQPFQRSLEVELPGLYTVGLSIVDSSGWLSATDEAGVPAEVSFAVGPAQDIGVSLTWSGDRFVDLDVHFVRPGGTIWDAGNGNGSDCHWDNTDPNWGDPQTTADDPLLAIDDIGTGNLLEIVELNQPEAGDYQLFVHFFDDARSRTGARACTDVADCAGAGDATVCSVGKCMAAVEVTIDLYLRGGRLDLAAQFPAFRNPQPLATPCDLWFVGLVHWPTPAELLAGTAPTFVPSGAPVIVSGTPTGSSCNPPRP